MPPSSLRPSICAWQSSVPMVGGMVSCVVVMARGSHSATSRFLRAWARMTYAKPVAYRRFDPHSAESASAAPSWWSPAV
eukprot:2539720-Pyramimonas_sp.AAC.1